MQGFTASVCCPYDDNFYEDFFGGVWIFGYIPTNLPIFIIETDNKQIPDEPKITARLGIVYNGPGQTSSMFQTPNHYNGYIGIELRGNSTQHYPKKPYAIETRDSLGENLNVSLLGMPAENDWVLRASYFDHTFIRNPLACHMSRLTGRWASRCRLVELVLNGEYMGIYILMEKIKRDNGITVSHCFLNDEFIHK